MLTLSCVAKFTEMNESEALAIYVDSSLATYHLFEYKISSLATTNLIARETTTFMTAQPVPDSNLTVFRPMPKKGLIKDSCSYHC